MKSIIMFSGKMRSGKNQSAICFRKVSDFYTREFAFASPLKKMCYEAFSNLNESQNYTFENWDDKKDNITRGILTGVGTNLMKKLNMKNYWVDQMINELELFNTNFPEDNVALITDVRFEHEIEAVRDFAIKNKIPFFIIRINRKNLINTLSSAHESHASETALDNYPCFSYTIQNDGSLDDLRDSVRNIYKDIMSEIMFNRDSKCII
jgi:hypothetical protein